LATSESTRARRFALPDLEDERADEVIEAFLEGPDVRRYRPPLLTSGVPSTTTVLEVASRAAATPRSTTDIRTIPGRIEWTAALERESARAARYGRPASVAIVELRPDRPGFLVDPWLRSLAGPIARVLRQGTRATDLVARVADTRFQVLMPETPETGAGRFAERVAGECRTIIQTSGAPVAVRLSVAAATEDHSLDEALAQALRSIEAA
jgi:hypothetical protein